MGTIFYLPDSSSGCLKASSHQGAIDVYVSQLGEVALTSQEGEPLSPRDVSWEERMTTDCLGNRWSDYLQWLQEIFFY